jgi:quinoprotein glucose dehydrogenase
MKPADATRVATTETTPLVVGNTMYLGSPYGHIVALDATTGKEIWSVDGQGSTRGLEYWPGDKNTPPQIIWVEGGGLVSVNAKSGQPNPNFGTNGKVTAEGAGGGGGSSPPIIYKNVIISGTANPYKDGRMGGDIRGFDAATGKQLWRFNTVPVKGEKGYETWAPGSAERQTSGGVHVWGLMTVDAERGLVYAPINAPDWNRYGGDHPGNNLYSSSIVALDAKTGKLVWHFQIVHHDIWDMDAESPPTLFDVKRGGKTIPAVGIISKSALLFIMNRVTGEPIYGVEERPVPQSEVPEERTSPTQPFPVKPEPLGRQTMSAAEINTVSPSVNAFCKDVISKNVGLGGPYMPPGFNHPTVNFPGPNGSVNWGGASFSPKLGYYFVNSQDLGQLTEEGPKGLPRQAIGVTGVGAPADDNIPYDMVGLNGRFKEPTSNMMCQQPPWGRLTAVNVNTGNIAWQVPLGITESLPPAQQKTGRPNSGGSIVTASGLVFIGATDDSHFRAFDAKTGKELWTLKIPAGSHSVPVTYMGKDGKQYLVFPATGGDFIEDPGADDELLAYRLP